MIVVRCGKSGVLRLGFTITHSPESPLPGKKVDIGGYSLYIDCAGSGSPTVVLEPLVATPSFARDAPLRAAITADTQTRVCTYDRAGIGSSDPRPGSATPSPTTFSNELHTLLRNAGVPGPYISVGGSFSGILMLSHAIRYPMNSLVSCSPTALIRTAPHRYSSAFRASPKASTSVPTSKRYVRRASVAVRRSPSTSTTTEPISPGRSSNNILARPPVGVGHAIGLEAPGFVAEAVRIVVASIRSGIPLPACEQTALPSFGGRCESASPL